MSKRRSSSIMPVAAAADSTVPTQPPAEAAFSARAASLTALVYEPGKSNARRAEELLQSFGFQVIVADDVEVARRHIDSGPGAHIVLCGMPGGEAVVRAVMGRGRERPALVVSSSGETQAGLAIAETTGADSFALRPYKRDALAATLHAVVALRDERRKAAAYEVEIEELREESRKHGEPDPKSGFHHFEFFKKLLVLELKRARRYGYSLAACLVAIDEGRLVGVPPATRAELAVQVARALRKAVRDIDMPVDYADPLGAWKKPCARSRVSSSRAARSSRRCRWASRRSSRAARSASPSWCATRAWRCARRSSRAGRAWW